MNLSTLDKNILRLKIISSIGNTTILKILQKFPELESRDIDYYLIKSVLKQKQINELNLKQETLENVLEEVLKNFEKNGVTIVNIKSESYPEQLKSIFNPPVQIYCKGTLSFPFQKSIAVVGTRKFTEYGKIFCEKFVTEFSSKKMSIISGLALGIDSIAHITAIQNGAQCVGVVGSGFDYIYPASNLRLYERILENNGLIISEYLPFHFPMKGNFPLRNRIIAGLAKSTLVIEAAEKSGSLITAKYAFDEGREVYALPADLVRPNSQGCNYLIKNQIAKLVNSPEDIFKDYGYGSEIDSHAKTDYSRLNSTQKKIIELISKESYSSDALADRLGIEVGLLNAELSEMELFDYIFQDEYRNWRLK